MNCASIYFFLSVTVLSTYAMDMSHLLATPFNHEKYNSYISLIERQEYSDGQSAAVVEGAATFDLEDELFYANMIIVKHMHAFENTKQISHQLMLLLRRFAFLSVKPGCLAYSHRFESILNGIVAKAVDVTREKKLIELQSQLSEQQATVNKWQDAAQMWKALQDDALRNMGQANKDKERVEKELSQTSQTLRQESAALLAQLDTSKKQLNEIGYELRVRVGQRDGLQAENDYLRQQMAKAQNELEKVKKEAHKKASENGRLKTKIKALELAKSKNS